MNRRALLKSIALKEIREIIRDGRMRLLSIIVLILALAALAFGAHQAMQAHEARESARTRATAQWQNQGEKNPHVAAHYGTHLFAPTSVITAIDPGVSPYLGRSVKIEAHKRNLASHSKAQDTGSGQQMGAFSVSLVLLQLVPLLIIALGYGVWSRERERGTLKQVLSTGINRHLLLWGKALGLTIVITTLLLVAGSVIVVILWWLGGGHSEVIMRLVLLTGGYGLYFGVFGALTMFASAAAGSSRSALVILLGIWGVFCLLMPRIASEFSVGIKPLPSKAELARRIAVGLEKGIDGNNQRDTTVDAMIQDMLAEQGFADAGLMLDPAVQRGAELRAEARWEDLVFDHHLNALADATAEQESFVSRFGLLSPFVAMRALSAALCGTDFYHHRHFTDHAEAWRKRFVDALNSAFADNAGEKGWAYKAGPELWKKAPKFVYNSPSLSTVLRQQLLSLISLLAWLCISLGLAVWAARRLRAV